MSVYRFGNGNSRNTIMCDHCGAYQSNVADTIPKGWIVLGDEEAVKYGGFGHFCPEHASDTTLASKNVDEWVEYLQSKDFGHRTGPRPRMEFSDGRYQVTFPPHEWKD